MTELHECIKKLTGDDEADRIYAAEDIGYANRAEGVPPLLAQLPSEPSRAVREAIFAALQQIEDDSVIEGALTLLDSEDAFIRNQAVEILRSRGNRAIPFLERAFRDGNNDRRKFAVDVLAKLRDADTSRIYDLALIDTDLNVVITAVESLGAMRQISFRERVEQLIAPETHPMLLCACIEALTQIGNPASVDSVRTRLGEGEPIPAYLQASYLKLLGAQGGAEHVDEVASLIHAEGLEPHVLNALTSLRSRFRVLDLPVSLAEPLQRIASSGTSPLLAYQAVRLLVCLLQIEEVLEFLTHCLQHSEKAIRIAAVQAMREAGSSTTAELLRERLPFETDEEVLQALTC